MKGIEIKFGDIELFAQTTRSARLDDVYWERLREKEEKRDCS